MTSRALSPAGPSHAARFERPAAALIGACSGLALSTAVSGDHVGAIAVAAVALAALIGLVRVMLPPGARAPIAWLVAIAFTMRVAAALLLYTGSLAIGRDGFITGDDAAYADLSLGFVRYFRGEGEAPYVPPYWNGDAYLFGTFVYLESIAFALFGPSVTVVEVLNAAFASGMVVVLYDLGRRILDERAGFAAAVVAAFYPSLVLWSSLNLKDALALFLITLTLWTLARFQERPRWQILAAAFLLLLPMESLRRYIYVLFVLIIPMGVAMVPGLSLPIRARWSAVALGVSAFFLAFNSATTAWLSPATLETLEHVRAAMAAGARTGYQERPPLQTQEGDTFVVIVPSMPTPAPEARTFIVIPAGTRIVPVAPGVPPPSPQPDTVYVRPGDVIVVGAPGATPAPQEQRKPLVLGRQRRGFESREEGVVLATARGGGDVMARTIAYVPKGLSYALLAPFPWAIERWLDALTIPEMLFWYATLVLLPWSLWRWRFRWCSFGPTLLFVLAALGVFTLAEGNVGTLFRHRAMIIPFTVLLATPGLVAIAERLAPRRAVPPEAKRRTAAATMDAP